MVGKVADGVGRRDFGDLRAEVCRWRPQVTLTTALTIASTSIRQDEHGRFCLNDLHKASGGDDKHKLLNWSRSQQAQELVAEIERGTANAHFRAIEATQGRYGGTYAVKELIYAYTMWLFPKFHLAVIRAYDQMVTQGRPAAVPDTNFSAMPVVDVGPFPAR